MAIIPSGSMYTDSAWTRMQSLNQLQCCSPLEIDAEALAKALDPGDDLESESESVRCPYHFEQLKQSHPHLFAPQPVFVTLNDLRSMAEVVKAIESVVNLPAFRDQAQRHQSPAMQAVEAKARGLSLGYDFHLDSSGPKLIEINTNAGGLLLSLAAAKAQRPCCNQVSEYLQNASNLEQVEEQIVHMFRSEFARARGHELLQRMVIVDLDPSQQFLYPEFLLYAELLKHHGIACDVVDPAELAIEDGKLVTTRDHRPIDLVYNRLTDFQLSENYSRVLRQAYLQDSTVITPHPLAHALYANKQNLVILSDRAQLNELGVDRDIQDLLEHTIPETRLVSATSPDRWWAERRAWFFKPKDGFGSKAVYRGDKLSRRVFAEIMNAGQSYVAQRVVIPSMRSTNQSGQSMTHKYDIRNFAYAGNVQLVTARLYQGQTTNLRSFGGGFAAVWSENSKRTPTG